MVPYNDQQSKKSQIRRMFNRIAPSYDRLNRLLSLGIDRGWRRQMVELVVERDPNDVLDVATGTGDVAMEILEHTNNCNIKAIDLSESMVELASQRFMEAGYGQRVELQAGDAEQMAVDDHSVDVVTVSFGVRNFQNIDLFMKEALRVLRPEGMLCILEFTTPKNKILAPLYRLYSKVVIPQLGSLISHDKDAYRYLTKSIEEFASTVDLVALMTEAGFGRCRTIALSAGIATIYIAIKE